MSVCYRKLNEFDRVTEWLFCYELFEEAVSMGICHEEYFHLSVVLE